MEGKWGKFTSHKTNGVSWKVLELKLYKKKGTYFISF